MYNGIAVLSVECYCCVHALYLPSSGDSVKKLVFLVFFKSAAIEAKIKKIADAFGAKRYPVPDMDNADAVRQLMDDNYGDLHDARLVLLKVGYAALVCRCACIMSARAAYTFVDRHKC